MDFLPNSDLFYIIVIRNGSFSLETFDLDLKWHQRTVMSEALQCFSYFQEFVLWDIEGPG